MDNASSAARVFSPRLPALNVAEAAYRGWHEASRLLDLLSPPPAAVADATLLADTPELADPAAALRTLRNVAALRFFNGAGDDDTCALVRMRFADHCSVIVAVANALASPMPWDRLDRDVAVAGDPAIAWEPNRHQWLVRLAQ